MKRSLIALLAFVTFMGAIPKAPFDMTTFAVGKPAAGVPLHGRPVVIVAFSSWCEACMQELPGVVRDYNALKDRVDFIGVDYLDNPAKGAAIIRTYHIGFPVVISQPAVQKGQHQIATPHSRTAPQATATPEPAPSPKLSAADRALVDYCSKHTGKQCIEYAKAHGIKLQIHAVETGPVASGGELLSLPETFIVDRGGVLRFNYQGYDTLRDDIRAGLKKLGVQ